MAERVTGGSPTPIDPSVRLTTIFEFPRAVREIENVWIPLADGCRLAARLWLPEDAERDPVPAILEYLPYRKRDATAARDELTHPYVAGHGYACIRVDLRGSGDSDGLMHDEYLKQEHDDALEVIAWIAAQTWCSGAVGMMGISWGGFNGLQVAARRPPALKAVITVCSTDDRYADDVHFIGGALLQNNLTWGSAMLAYMTRPPDPALVGERWRELWLDRLNHLPFFSARWLAHQQRDTFWKHGSVCEDFAAITCPVFAVGGWTDGYPNPIPRLLAGLRSPCRGLIGPWGHRYPHMASPGPQIGFLQEALRWWDQWLKGIDTGVMDEPVLRAWMQESVRPAPWYGERPGRWVAEASWPPTGIALENWYLTATGIEATPAAPAPLILKSPETVGLLSGTWSVQGVTPDEACDQREEDGKSLVFDTAPLTRRLELLGSPTLEIDLSSDKPNAKLVVRLCDVHPDGASTRVSYGILNLTHRDSHEFPTALAGGGPPPLPRAHSLEGDGLRLPARPSPARRAVDDVLAHDLAVAGGGDAHDLCGGILPSAARTHSAGGRPQAQALRTGRSRRALPDHPAPARQLRAPGDSRPRIGYDDGRHAGRLRRHATRLRHRDGELPAPYVQHRGRRSRERPR
jgi:putative CocE/NonD family hydrolase